ncbi:MAG: hypothetical protein QOG89_3437 [Thermomicrobiales bacterium]|nr:hypothetical protein [Thermomicrobiales bacterium]
MTRSALGRLAGSLTGRSSRRAAVLGGAGLTVGLLGLTGERSSAAPMAQTDDEFESGGLGLSSDAFEALYGPSTVGQGAIIYEIDGESYAVRGTPGIDLVTSIHWSASTQEGVSFDEAVERIAPFLPVDARLREVYTTPAAGIGPFATAHLYKSAGLATVLAGGPTVTSGNFLVAFNLVGGFSTNVLGVNAFVGAKPETESDR